MTYLYASEYTRVSIFRLISVYSNFVCFHNYMFGIKTSAESAGIFSVEQPKALVSKAKANNSIMQDVLLVNATLSGYVVCVLSLF